MKKILSLFVTLALLTALPVRGEDVDSLQIYVQAGDSCMQQFNTFEALKHYQRAYKMAEAQDSVRFSMDHKFGVGPYVPEDKIPREVRLKLADCYYKRANYRQTAELLKNMPEDSLSHEAFRELAYSYQKQGDNDSFIYWAGQLVNRFPMDGEMVAGLTLAYAKANQPQNGIICGLKYCQRDSTNILVNRALADAWFINRDFTAASKLYNKLLEQGDSTFNTLYSAGMCYSQLDSLEHAYKYLQPAVFLSGMQHAGSAYRLGVVCVDTKRYSEGLSYLNLAKQLMLPDTTIMKAITLSEGEGYYLTQHYPEAVEAWKEHLTYNPSSVATYYNIANASAYLLKDKEQAKQYYLTFIEKAAEVEKPTKQLDDMVLKAKDMLKVYDLQEKYKSKQAQKERIDTVIPKFLSNGYFFREMPQLPDGEKSMMRLKDKEGNSITVININTKLPESLIRKAIPREQVHNADQFLDGLNMMATMTSLTQAGIKADGTWYSPKEGEPFPQFSEKDMDGRTWTNDSIRGRVMVINLWYSGCGPCRVEMPILSKWKEQLPDVMFFSATYHNAETAKRITDKGFPLTIVVDKKGIVRHAVHGTNEAKRAELLAKIKEVEAE